MLRALASTLLLAVSALALLSGPAPAERSGVPGETAAERPAPSAPCRILLQWELRSAPGEVRSSGPKVRP